jgi:hypothetical protein
MDNSRSRIACRVRGRATRQVMTGASITATAQTAPLSLSCAGRVRVPRTMSLHQMSACGVLARPDESLQAVHLAAVRETN